MPDGRAKPLALVKGHRTKAEMAVRAKAEAAMVSGDLMKPSPEVRADKAALKEFKRIAKMFNTIGKNDGMFESVINRYCLLHSECVQVTEMMLNTVKLREELKKQYAAGTVEILEYLEQDGKLSTRYINLDRALMGKRKAMLDIEKENIMTIQSALRSIPKKPEQKAESPMAEFLKRKAGGKDGT